MIPMEAATLPNLEEAKLPAYGSPKLDGIRCLIHNGIAVSKSLTPIPNKFVQEQLKGLPDGLDGELMVKGDFNTIQSAIMSEDGEPDFLYVLFDKVGDGIYMDRYNTVCDIVTAVSSPRLKVIQTILFVDKEELKQFEEACVKGKYEGIILRSIESKYKAGRSTLKQFWLVKHKRRHDCEAQVIGFEQLLSNDNEQTKDALGHSKRSTAGIGMRPVDCLGSLCLYDAERNIEYNLGTGFTQEQREEIWKNQKKYIGKYVTHDFAKRSAKGVPIDASFKAFREDHIELVKSE